MNISFKFVILMINWIEIRFEKWYWCWQMKFASIAWCFLSETCSQLILKSHNFLFSRFCSMLVTWKRTHATNFFSQQSFRGDKTFWLNFWQNPHPTTTTARNRNDTLRAFCSNVLIKILRCMYFTRAANNWQLVVLVVKNCNLRNWSLYNFTYNQLCYDS